MRFTSVDDMISQTGSLSAFGPLAIILVEEPVDLEDCVAHHLNLGFQRVVLAVTDWVDVPEGPVWQLRAPVRAPDALNRVLSPLLSAARGVWVYWGFQGEYLWFPYADTRDVRDLLAFHTEERRKAMAGVVVDLYESNGTEAIDATGYFARETIPRAPRIYGGLRRRFAPYVPIERRHIDRIPLIQGSRGLSIDADGTLSDPERNTRACAWHANLTCAVLSRRTVRALKRHPEASSELFDIQWEGSVAWSGQAQQLMDLGLMEAGQWF